MRVVVVADRLFAVRERAMLARLEVGLADEGVRVVHAVPAAVLEVETVGLYSTLLGYDDTGPRWSQRRRAQQLAEALDRTGQLEPDDPVSLIHCFGGRAWRLACELGCELDVPVLLEVWRASLVGKAIGATTPKPDVPTPHLAAPGEGLAGALRRRGVRAEVHLTPWGVHTPPAGEIARREDGAASVGVLVEGSDHRWVQSALVGLSVLAKRLPDLLVFVSAPDGAANAIWRAARKLKLLDRLSLVPDIEARREPALGFDALILPEPCGQHRTIALDAMAWGVPLVAAADPLVETLIDGRTARLVQAPSQDAWADAVEAALSPTGAAPLVESARAYVREQRPATRHVAAVLAAYNSVTAAHRPAAAAAGA